MPATNANDTKSNVALIAKYFDLKGKDAIQNVKALTDKDKQELGDAIRNGSLNY